MALDEDQRERFAKEPEKWSLDTNSAENTGLSASVRFVESGAENIKLIVCVLAVGIGAGGIRNIASVLFAVLRVDTTNQVADARVAQNAVKLL
jgi:hypothetical protein